MLEKEITFDRFVRILGIVLLVGGVLYTMNFLSSVLLPFFVAAGISDVSDSEVRAV